MMSRFAVLAVLVLSSFGVSVAETLRYTLYSDGNCQSQISSGAVDANYTSNSVGTGYRTTCFPITSAPGAASALATCVMFSGSTQYVGTLQTFSDLACQQQSGSAYYADQPLGSCGPALQRSTGSVVISCDSVQKSSAPVMTFQYSVYSDNGCNSAVSSGTAPLLNSSGSSGRPNWDGGCFAITGVPGVATAKGGCQTDDGTYKGILFVYSDAQCSTQVNVFQGQPPGTCSGGFSNGSAIVNCITANSASSTAIVLMPFLLAALAAVVALVM